jgi:hypothetical protein
MSLFSPAVDCRSVHAPEPLVISAAQPSLSARKPLALPKVRASGSFGGPWLVAGGADACCVSEHVHVVCRPADAPARGAVVWAVGEVVSPGSRGWAFAGGQGQVHGPGADRGADADHDEHGGAVGAGVHRRAVWWPGGPGRVPRRARVVTMTAGPR